MAKDEKTVEVPEKMTEVVKITLNEYCMRLSEKVARPELIGAFAFSSNQAGKVSGTTAEFDAFYNAFVTKPV